MRHGFTTGSCAAAAAGAACYMLLTGHRMEQVTVPTPGGLPFHAQIEGIEMGENFVRCSVVKDGGDDPDITTGAHIMAEVRTLDFPGKVPLNRSSENIISGNNSTKSSSTESDSTESDSIRNGSTKSSSTECGSSINVNSGKSTPGCCSPLKDSDRVIIDGGFGVGRVTMPGLDQPVGAAAINHVPREMITRQVLEVCSECEYPGKIQVIISVPEGEKLAAKTFNPRLGIVGGISILGTSGIVEPMSTQALLDTIRTELNQKKALGWKIAAVSPGNYGLDFMKSTYDFDLDRSVKCSNFIGDTIDMAVQIGFKGMLLTGHIGKLVKVSGGIMNTHSKEGDCRMELLAAAAIRSGCDLEPVRQILSSISTEEGIRILLKEGKCQEAMQDIMERIMFFLKKRADDRLAIECMVYSSEYGLLGASEGAERMLEEIRRQDARNTMI